MALKCLLLWISGLERADQFPSSAVSSGQVPGREYRSLGGVFDATGYAGALRLYIKLSISAAAKNFVQLAVLRVISGAAEACR